MLACDLSQESNEIRFSGLHRHFRKNDPTDNIYYIKSPKKKKVLKEDIGLKNMINKSYGSKWSFIIIVVVVV